MYSLIYRSTASPNLDSQDIQKIHKEAIDFNSKNDVTGCLLHHQGKFVQLIEGSKEVITFLIENIKKDRRHTEVEILNTQFSSIRMFPNWSMIFDDIDLGFSNAASDKKKYFECIFHSSYAAYTPGRSKLELWRQVNSLLIPKQGRQLSFS